MTEPSLVAQTISISHNVAIVAGAALVFAGFMVGYSIAWWQRGRHDAQSLADLMRQTEPGETRMIIGDLETRFRRSQG